MSVHDNRDDSNGQDSSPTKTNLTIPREWYLLPGFMTTTGMTIGLFRGTRKESLRFLAENAHRPPRTMQGWYYYNKTKNYRVMWGGIKQAGVDGARLGVTGLSWVVLEQGIKAAGLDEVKEIGASIGTAGVFSALYRLPWLAARRAIFLGFLCGGTMRMLRFAQARIRERAEDTVD